MKRFRPMGSMPRCPPVSSVRAAFARPFALALGEALNQPTAATDPTLIGKQFGSAFVIDPMGVAAMSFPDKPPQPSRHAPAATFPASASQYGDFLRYAKSPSWATSVWSPWWGTNGSPTGIWPIARVTFRQPTTGWQMDKTMAEHFFRGNDDLATDLPPRDDRPAIQNLGQFRAQTPLARQWTGDYSWIVTVVPTTNAARNGMARDPEGFAYDVSVVVFYKRVLPPGGPSVLAATSPSLPDYLNAMAENERDVKASVISTGLNGGELLLTDWGDNTKQSAFSGLKIGQWIMLCGPHPNSNYSTSSPSGEPRFVLNWYQVLSVDTDEGSPASIQIRNDSLPSVVPNGHGSRPPIRVTIRMQQTYFASRSVAAPWRYTRRHCGWRALGRRRSHLAAAAQPIQQRRSGHFPSGPAADQGRNTEDAREKAISRNSHSLWANLAGEARCGTGIKSRESKVESREPRIDRCTPPRRGVLLLVVLSMLVLFMLMGTAFLMTSNQSRMAAKGSAKGHRLGNDATRLLDRALMHLVRDSDNEHSAIRYHSLLRDLYGTDGFQGVIYSPAPNVAFDPNDPAKQVTRFAGALAGNAAAQLGPTNGQFIDLYVSENAYSVAAGLDYARPYDGGAYPLGLGNVLKLDRNVVGEPQPYPLPLTKGYFNGCLLTITSGAAAGRSTRILDYEFLGELTPATATATAQRLFRLRVMAVPRKDGQPLQIDAARPPEIGDLAGASFTVNGRAFSGTGVGYNPLAAVGQPRLSALELFRADTNGNYIGAELALLPNSAYFNPLVNFVASPPAGTLNPFASPAAITNFGILNNPTANMPFFNYGGYVGPGGGNEGYDAADFQNLFLALQTVSPRSQGRVVTDKGTYSVAEFFANPTGVGNFLRLDLEDVPLPSFHRPELVNFWYHRLLMLLANGSTPTDDQVRGILQPYDVNGNPQFGLKPEQAALICAIKRQIMLRPIRDDNPDFDGGNPSSVANPSAANNLVVPVGKSTPTQYQITYPIPEVVGPWDVDNDNDGVPDSVWVDLGDPIQQTEDGTRYKTLYAFLVIDLDSRLNVNAHGLADDIVPPILDTTKANFFDLTGGTPGNLAHDTTSANPNIVRSTLQLSRGLGYGPAEISLRPVFPAPLGAAPSYTPVYGNRSEAAGPVDSYASLLTGRLDADGKAIYGRYGYDLNVANEAATPGTNYLFNLINQTKELAVSPRWYTGEQATPNLAAQIKFFDYPWSSRHPAAFGQPWEFGQPSAFGTPPDLKGRYALGLDYSGQPVYEATHDLNPNTALLANPSKWLPFNLLANSPYELDLSSQQRRDDWAASFANTQAAFNASIDRSFNRAYDPAAQIGLNDDAPLSPTDLEKVLRATDADAGTLPSRLWDVVNDFDPLKLMNYDPNRVQKAAIDAFGTNPSAAAVLAAAQEIAGINRHLVTTDSYDLPVPSANLLSRLIYGADGKPGKANVDDNNDGVVDDPGEIGWGGLR